MPSIGLTLRIRVEDIRLKPNIPAGMDPCVLLGFVPRLRKTGDDLDPVLVRRHGDHWLLLDGRHRFFAAVIAGRPDILAEVEAEALPPTPSLLEKWPRSARFNPFLGFSHD